MQQVHQDERRSRHERIEGRGGARAAQHIAAERARAEQPQRPQQHRGTRARLQGVGLRQQQDGAGEGDRADDGQQREGSAPAEPGRGIAAQHRRDRGRCRHHQGQHGKLRRRAIRCRRIADHRPTQHQSAACADRLQNARDHQRPGVRCGGGRDAREREQRQPTEQHRPPSEPVGHRPVQQLADRQADQVQRDGELHGAGRDAERPRRVGQRRDDQVHAQRAAGGDRHDQCERRAIPSAVRRCSVPLHAGSFLSRPFDAKPGCKRTANGRERAPLEPGGSDRLGDRVRPQCRSVRTAAAAAAGTARHGHDAERTECRLDVHRRHHRAAAGAAPGPAVRRAQLPAGLLQPRYRAVPGDEGVRQHRRVVRAARGPRHGGVQHIHDRRGLDQPARRRRGPRPDHRDLCGRAVGRVRRRPADPVADRHRGLVAIPGQRRHIRAGDAAAGRCRRCHARLRPRARRQSAAHVRPGTARSSALSRCSVSSSLR